MLCFFHIYRCLYEWLYFSFTFLLFAKVCFRCRSRLKDMTTDARDLLDKLLEVDPTLRVTSTEALSHPWLTVEDDCIDDGLSELMRPRSSSILKVDSTFRESFTRPTPPRKVPDNHKTAKDTHRSSSHTGFGLFRFFMNGLSSDDKKDAKKDDHKDLVKDDKKDKVDHKKEISKSSDVRSR